MLGEPSKRELLWRQYELQVDMYKFYFDIAIRINIFFYAVTGAMLSYYFANASNPLVKYSLWLPVFLSLTLTALSFYGSRLLRVLLEDMNALAERLELDTIPAVAVLIMSLQVFSFLFFFTGIAIIVLIIHF